MAREPGADEKMLGVVGHPDGIQVGRRSVRLDDHGSAVSELHAPDDVDSSGAELNTGDGAAEPACRPGVEERVQFRRCHGAVDGGFGASDRGELGPA